MIKSMIGLFALASTIGLFALVWQMQSWPQSTGRAIETLAGFCLVFAVPLAITLLTMAATGKWEGVYMLSVLINLEAAALWVGYRYGRHTKRDAFECAMAFGLCALIAFGGPLGAIYLP